MNPHPDSPVDPNAAASPLGADVTWGVVIVYDDLPSGKRAINTLAGVTRQLSGTLPLQPSLWRFDLLEDPDWRAEATAEDGVDALALVASTRPDLVLMDLQMPRLNGLQATRQIRAEFPAVRVIMTTFDNSQERRVNDYDHMGSIRSEVREELPSRNIPEPGDSQLCAYEPAS